MPRKPADPTMPADPKPPCGEIALLANGRYAIVKHKLTRPSGEKVLRVHYLGGFPATVEARQVMAVWSVGRPTIANQAGELAVSAAYGEPVGNRGSRA